MPGRAQPTIQSFAIVILKISLSTLSRLLVVTISTITLTFRCKSACAEQCCFVGTKSLGGPQNRTIGARKSTKVIRDEGSHELSTSTRSKLPRLFRPTEIRKPCHYIKPMDPAHPNMRTYIEADRALSANLMPENSFWKDHDSEVF